MRCRWPALGLALLTSGCFTVSSVQTAHSIGKGQVQFAIEPGVGGSADTAGAAIALPTFNAAIRAGVSDRLDLGARFGTLGYELTSKYEFTDPATTGTHIAMAPSAAIFFGGIVNLKLALLFGVPVGTSELVFGPRAHNILVLGSGGSDSAELFLVGGQVGLAVRVADGFQVLPEFGLEYAAVSGTYTGDSTSVDAFTNAVIGSFNVGFIVGGK